jgi:hypothetical protein
MHTNVPFDSRPVIERFMRQRGAGPLGLARHAPEPWARVTDCIANVLSKVERDGGCEVFGWIFSPRFNPEYGCYLVATHHAVWNSQTDFGLVDLTPLHPDERHHPIRSGGDTIFLVDESALPHRQGRVVVPLPLCFIAVTSDPVLEDYLRHITREEEAQWEEQRGQWSQASEA